MKILVLSDSHGKKTQVENLLNTLKYDHVFFLGDGLNDFSNLTNYNIIKVTGNCDLFSDEPITRFETVENVKIMLTHGHNFRAKYLIEPMVQYAQENNCQMLCFGHTHKQKYEIINGVTVVNPGTFKMGNYAEITIIKGTIRVELKSI